MKWFKHMANAHDSKDLTKVRMKYGANGYAIYWYCLELIAGDLGQEDNITFELKHDAEVIGHNLKIDSVLVEEIMRYMIDLRLFEQSAGRITCLKLAKYLDKKTTRNETIHKIVDTAHRLSRTIPDIPGRSGLDTDSDTDTDKPFVRVPDASRPTPAKKFIKPTLSEVTAYCLERNNNIDPQHFIDKHDANGWKVGKVPMKDWKATIRTWEAVEKRGGNNAAHQHVDNSAPARVRRANERQRQAERKPINIV